MPTVECLRCGSARAAAQATRAHHFGADECPRCGYVGWAASSDLSESIRKTLRERPLERRRIRALAQG